MKHAIALLLAAFTASCGVKTGSESPGPLPTVRIEGEATLEREVETSAESSQKCVVTQRKWRHPELELRHAELGAFATVVRGDVTLRIDGALRTALLTVDLEGWRVRGAPRLDALEVFAREPLLLAGAVWPHARTPLRLRVSPGRMELVGSIDVHPHRLVGAYGHTLEVVEPTVACDAISLGPAAHGSRPSSVAGLKLGAQPSWSIPNDTRLDVGPRDGASPGTLRISGTSTTVRELERRGSRCWVALDTRTATLLGWLDCSAFQKRSLGRVGQTHRARLPHLRRGYLALTKIRCLKEVPLVARHQDGRTARVGTIAPGTRMEGLRGSDHYALYPPHGIWPADDMDLTIQRDHISEGCTLEAPP